MRLLLVEDEEMLSAAIAKGLRRQGYALDTAFDGEEALQQYELNEYDLIILDLNLPVMDGLDVLNTIRERDQDTKVLVLSARSTVANRVEGLDVGANDYLVKPFDFAELEARIRNLLRRFFTQAPTELRLGDLCMDTAAKKVFAGEQALLLTKKEYAILELLLLNTGKVQSAEEIIAHVWDDNADPFSNALQYHIHMLKKKLAAAGCRPRINNMRGQGYILEVPS